MRALHIPSAVFLILAFAGHGWASSRQFDFGGTFTNVTEVAPWNSPYHTGDPFSSTLYFNPDAPDLSSDPRIGWYKPFFWRLPGYQSLNMIVTDTATEILSIYVNDNTTSDDRFRITYYANLASAEIELTFPPSTFTSDTLPMSLDLNAAILKRFGAGVRHSANPSLFVISYTANITAFEASVPEPIGVGLLLTCIVPRRRAMWH